MQSSILPRGHNYREQTYEFNDEEHIFAMLLILVLALLFCPSLAEEELRGVKKKYADSVQTYYMERFNINYKKKFILKF
jgi:hypothetical protein